MDGYSDRVPELPDIVVYIEALESRVVGRTLSSVRLNSPFLLRTVKPPVSEATGRKVERLKRIGKRIGFGMEGDLWLVLHLMIAGRLHWRKPGAPLGGRRNLAAFDFGDEGSLVLTEAGTERRAGLFVMPSEASATALNPGGLEVLDATAEEFARVLTSENHTLKRALTDPKLFSGIGNAYSDEILHRAQMSPVLLTQKMKPEDIARLHQATIDALLDWTARLRAEAAGKVPEKVTAFRPDMAVHGKYGQPCPVCGTKVQRIRYASNETNYCPRCQTGGKLLADRSLSRLLREDWPKRIEEIE
ncbi:MAG: DNA-formamidopyrimidine glycosylase family protein [Bryobacteraceae bacterium]|nr:DNA-formamidopyrimidine glycosylase family protein [Bryobacteraceae bacterium]